MKEKRIAVLIPCRNEEKTIGKVVSDFKTALPKADIWVCDNASADHTADKAAEAGAHVILEREPGKGNAVKHLFREVEADCYILVDGDDTYEANDAPAMADFVLNRDADMVVSERSGYFEETTRRFHGAGNLAVRIALNLVFGTDIKDVMSGYRAMSRAFVKTFPVLSGGFEIETEMAAHAADKRLKIANYPSIYKERPDPQDSKVNTFRDGAKILFTILRLFKDYRPMTFFGWISAILLIISAFFFVPVLAAYLQTGAVERFPTLIVCGFTATAALQSLFSGVILQSLRRKDKADFERDYARWYRS